MKQQSREANKDRISCHKSEKIKCECGCTISRVNLAQHRRSKKHEQLLQTIDQLIGLIVFGQKNI